MEILNQENKNSLISLFSSDYILLLYVINCFLPLNQQNTLTIIIKILEIKNIIENMKNEPNYYPNNPPNLETALTNLKSEPHLRESKQFSKIIDYVNLIEQLLQMKDLLSAINEMKAANNESNSDNNNDFDLSALSSLLSSDNTVIMELLKSFSASNNNSNDSASSSDINPEGDMTNT